MKNSTEQRRSTLPYPVASSARLEAVRHAQAACDARRATAGAIRRIACAAAIGFALVAIATGAARAQEATVAPLRGYGADLSRTSVSGLSSGAFMAAQFDVAYSGELIGAGIVAGGEFYCAGAAGVKPLSLAAVTSCMQPIGPAPKAEIALKDARQFAAEGVIDETANLTRQRIYLFSGAKDSVVFTKVVDQAERFFELAGVPKQSIDYEKLSNAGHALLTNRTEDIACDSNAGPYINNCGIEQSHQILRWIYGTPGVELHAADEKATGELIAFDQSEFDPERRASLARDGYVYVPTSCRTGGCAIHVVFHGCLQNAHKVGLRFVRDTGYNEFADTNKIIVLYPQIASPERGSPSNPLQCWDFWGYTSDDASHPDFYTRKAPQMAAVMKMIERLHASPR
ncbi:extracellular catalytic domain type 2 short-chain-length polyhydroxyalkanoate depolymerase [Trinickia acidisoli]|uniref:extracellular catalytic domain type 2 short-chain-length polyhydroxyalkanoate depolymerase n=1 Tax=Trinickia acidisoli TaxID=2767482 RepID=UPI001A8D113C|nr:poly(3-hydroxybutyrate) depolymerase [Trinickia acidisoli]